MITPQIFKPLGIWAAIESFKAIKRYFVLAPAFESFILSVRVAFRRHEIHYFSA